MKRATRSKTVKVRMRRSERAAWDAAAQHEGLTLSEWIRRRCMGDDTVRPPD